MQEKGNTSHMELTHVGVLFTHMHAEHICSTAHMPLEKTGKGR